MFGKTDIFLTVYGHWLDREFDGLEELLAENASMAQLIDLTTEGHREFLIFRRSLRYLSLTEPMIRQVRAESRMRQVSRILG